jgi:hypothetical protein
MVHKHLNKKLLVRNPTQLKRKGTNLDERLGEVFRAVLERGVPILRMTSEKLRLAVGGH